TLFMRPLPRSCANVGVRAPFRFDGNRWPAAAWSFCWARPFACPMEKRGNLTTPRQGHTMKKGIAPPRTSRSEGVMATDIRLKEALPEITEAVVSTYLECNRTSHLGHKPLPSREAIG